MRWINKHREPREWEEFRATPGATYDDVDAPKDELRRALVREQGGICCYCMARIRPDRRHMRIEHWSARSAGLVHELEYGNLLGACTGGESGRASEHHCDVSKGDQAISTHPADPKRDIAPLFRYLRNGAIRAADKDERIEADIAVLALDHARATRGREELIAAVTAEVTRLGPGVSRSRLERFAAFYESRDADGQLRPFCQAAVYWLRRQARRR